MTYTFMGILCKCPIIAVAFSHHPIYNSATSPPRPPPLRALCHSSLLYFSQALIITLLTSYMFYLLTAYLQRGLCYMRKRICHVHHYMLNTLEQCLTYCRHSFIHKKHKYSINRENNAQTH